MKCFTAKGCAATMLLLVSVVSLAGCAGGLLDTW